MAPPDGSKPRAVRPQLRPRGGGRNQLTTALAVPLASDGEDLGHLIAYAARPWRASATRPSGSWRSSPGAPGPAIDNARRFREARQLADMDALTGLHNRRYFHETLLREAARASRYERDLALMVLDLDDFKSINDRIGHLAGDAVLAEAAERLRDVVRSADVACRVGGDEFAIILPESGVADAEGLYRRLQATMAKRPVGQAGRLAISAGIAELRAGRRRRGLLRARGRGPLHAPSTPARAAWQSRAPPPIPLRRLRLRSLGRRQVRQKTRELDRADRREAVARATETAERGTLKSHRPVVVRVQPGRGPERARDRGARGFERQHAERLGVTERPYLQRALRRPDGRDAILRRDEQPRGRDRGEHDAAAARKPGGAGEISTSRASTGAYVP